MSGSSQAIKGAAQGGAHPPYEVVSIQQADPPPPWGDPADPKIETNFTSYVWAYEWEE